ncbi:hypothetical protein [Bacillus cereus]|uniref:hypothetical protein n=1 Tax=Bacillus cereus TaxID=1396 RepID=UPI000DEEB0C4|nr:hypothetical protein [Bacillus cereus]RCL12760.1 hypothetical protein BLO02_027200 [Bacillus cereus]TKH53642.1 hypothetical protein FC677_21530 [Bacillus cereus]
MRDVTKRLQRILSELESLESDMQQTNIRRSQTDIAQQDILHTIEIETFTTARGNYMLKELKRIRKERRKAKDDQAVLQSVMHTLKGVKQRVECSIGSVIGVNERQQERKVTKGY